MSTDNFTSLMDLAVTDTTEVASIASPLPTEGIYVVLWNEINMRETENDDPDRPAMVSIRMSGTIEHFEPTKADSMTEKQLEGMIGRNFNEMERLYMDDVPKAIGLLKGRYERARFPTTGQLGGIDGVTGWVDGIIGQRCGVRVKHSTTVNGDKRAYIDWLSPKELRQAKITWDEMGRPALNPDGSEIEEDKLYR